LAPGEGARSPYCSRPAPPISKPFVLAFCVPPDGHAFVNPNRGQKSKLCRRGCDRPDDSTNSDNQKKAPTLDPNRGFSLKRFRAKACPGLDPGWIPVRVKKTRQNKYL